MAGTTWNPSDKNADVTLSGGNLIATGVSTGGNVRAIDKQVLGKFYWEYTCNAITGSATAVGVASSLVANNSTINTTGGSCGVNRAGTIYIDGNASGSTLGSIVSGTVCVAFDVGARLIWLRLGAAGNWNGSAAANPATGVGGLLITKLGDGIPAYPYAWVQNNADAVTANFGDTAFVGAVPSGYTSGFTSGASVPTNAIASQALAEHWLTTDPAAQITQVALEHWASVTSDNLQAVVTQVLLEHWMSVAEVPVIPPAVGGPIVTMIH